MQKTIALTLAALLFSGCTHTQINYTCQEHCGFKGMLCQGQSDSSESRDGMIINSNGSYGTSTGTSTGTAFHCTLPKTAEEKSEFEAMKPVLEQKAREVEEIRATDADDNGKGILGVLVMAAIIGLGFLALSLSQE